tara:strand:- start:219 stop:1418 length:1200 start_codon:yes stop_codon:yes gene_type:complete
MHKFIYSSKDAWISELSSSNNYGYDEILELKKVFKSTATSSIVSGVTRILTYFDISGISQSIVDGDIPAPSDNKTKYFLRLYSTEPSDLPKSYNLSAFAVSESWEEGTGKFADSPPKQDGVSWDRTDQSNTTTDWSDDGGMLTSGSRTLNSGSGTNDSGSSGGGTWYTGSTTSGYECTQSFSYESPDINMDVTTIVDKWLKQERINNGFIITRSGSMSGSGDPQGEESDTSKQNLSFFSRNTNTIYPPKLEVRWDDHVPVTGSYTASLNELDVSGDSDNYVYMKGIRPSYKENEEVKFKVGSRKRYISRTFSTSVQTISGSYIPEGSGSYSIVDIATGETIIPFSDYTKLSGGSDGNYFIQDLNTFQPNRIYKIIVKVKYNDGQELIFDDDNFQFKLTR